MRETKRPSAPIAPAVGASFVLSLLGVGLALIAWSRTRVMHNVPLTSALNGQLVRFQGRRAGGLAYYQAGAPKRGTPTLVLLHSINAAASSFEMKPLFDHYARRRRVVALDLPGYGFSDRADREYSPALFRDAILDLVEHLGSEPVDAAALSLSGEFLALAAQAQPQRFHTLTFISPTGFSRRNEQLRPSDALLRLLRVPLWRRPIYDLLTSRPSLTLFLAANLRRPLDRALVDYAYLTSHQPNAEFAPLYFLSLKLFTPKIIEVYRQLTQPCLLIYGRDPFVGYAYADELRQKPNWRIVALENAGALTHWDNPEAVIAQMDALSKRCQDF